MWGMAMRRRSFRWFDRRWNSVPTSSRRIPPMIRVNIIESFRWPRCRFNWFRGGGRTDDRQHFWNGRRPSSVKGSPGSSTAETSFSTPTRPDDAQAPLRRSSTKRASAECLPVASSGRETIEDAEIGIVGGGCLMGVGTRLRDLGDGVPSATRRVTPELVAVCDYSEAAQDWFGRIPTVLPLCLRLPWSHWRSI